MKTLHLSSNRWNSAITEYALSAVKSLMLRGGEHCFCPVAGSPAERRAETLGIPVASLGSFGLNKFIELRDMIDKYKPETVFCYGGPEQSLMTLLKATNRSRHEWKGPIVRFRGQDLPASGPLQSWKYRVSHSPVSLVIAPSLEIKSKHVALAPRIPCQQVILGCPSGVYRFVDSKPATSHPQIVLLGRLDPVKGHARALQIFSQVINQWHPNSGLHPVLHIIGEPANLSRDDLLRLIAQANLTVGKEVLLTTERVSNIPELLSQASLGLISSLDSEIICRVAEEFLLCGTPVIVSGVGSLREVLVEGSFGASYQSLDTEATVALMTGMLLKSQGEDHVSKQNRSRLAQGHFSWETMGAALERLLLQVKT